MAKFFSTALGNACFSKLIPVAQKSIHYSLENFIMPTIFALGSWNFAARAWLNLETATIPKVFLSTGQDPE